jgi:hypothetical protein
MSVDSLQSFLLLDDQENMYNRIGETMGYRIWSFIQTILGLFGCWVLLDYSLISQGSDFTLFIGNIFTEMGKVNALLGPISIVVYVLAAILILQLVKSIVVIVRD